MSTGGVLPGFVWALVGQLRRRQVSIGVDDVVALRQAVAAGFGVDSREALRELCVGLWAKSQPEMSIVRAQFELVVADEWDADAAPEGEIGGPEASVPTIPGEPAGGDGAGRSQPAGGDGTTAPLAIRPMAGLADIRIAGGSVESGYSVLPQYPVTDRAAAQAWRRLRRPVRTGPAVELDVAATVERRSACGLATPPVLVPRRRNLARLLLLVDRQGSMAPYHGFVDRVVSTIQHKSSLSEVKVWYFHDVPSAGADPTPLGRLAGGLSLSLDPILADIGPNDHGFVSADPELLEPTPLRSALEVLGPEVGTAVISDAGAARGTYDVLRLLETIAFARAVLARRSRLVWLNPAPESRWARSTAGQIARHLPMSRLDLPGTHRAVDLLRGHPRRLERPL